MLVDVNAVLFDGVAELIQVQNLVETFKQERSRCALGRISMPSGNPEPGSRKSARDPRVWVQAVDEGEVPIRSTYLALLTDFLGAFQQFAYSTAISTDLYYKITKWRGMEASSTRVPPYVVEFRGVAKAYPGGTPALRGVDFFLRAGERVVLLGPNGAGKSTLVKILAGLLAPDAGELKVFGGRPNAGKRRRLGFLFEEAENLYGYLTAWENLLFYGRLVGVPERSLREKALELLTRFGLEAARDRLAQNLSRGQKQRLALASTLVQGAEAYVLDEPTLGLDLEAQNALIARIRELSTVLITTHDPVLAWEIADRFVVLKAGEVKVVTNRSDLVAKGVHDSETLRSWLLEVYR